MARPTTGKRKLLYSLLCLALLISAVGGCFSYAAYVNQGYKKGVISTAANEPRFSSNILQSYADLSSVQGSSFLFRAVEGSESILTITVSNISKKGLVNQRDIEYNLTVRVNRENAAAIPANCYLRVENSSLTNDSASYNGVLLGGTAQTHSYTLTLPMEFINNASVEVSAVPTAETKVAAGNIVLYSVVRPVSAAESFSFEGKFTDNGIDGENFDHYHAYNYQIQIKDGEGSICLKWYDDLKIDPFAAIEQAAAGTGEDDGGSYHTLTFPVSASEKEYYDFVFFKNEPVGDYQTLSGLVSVEAVNE